MMMTTTTTTTTMNGNERDRGRPSNKYFLLFLCVAAADVQVLDEFVCVCVPACVLYGNRD